nr:probable protein phosphatase 2C 25 [Ipomoea batatas]
MFLWRKLRYSSVHFSFWVQKNTIFMCIHVALCPVAGEVFGRRVLAEPETRILPLNDGIKLNQQTCSSALLVSNQEAVDAVRPLCTGLENSQLLSACRKLVDLSVSRGSFDDVSVNFNFEIFNDMIFFCI